MPNQGECQPSDTSCFNSLTVRKVTRWILISRKERFRVTGSDRFREILSPRHTLASPQIFHLEASAEIPLYQRDGCRVLDVISFVPANHLHSTKCTCRVCSRWCAFSELESYF
eukprot:IDg13814t1